MRLNFYSGLLVAAYIATDSVANCLLVDKDEWLASAEVEGEMIAAQVATTNPLLMGLQSLLGNHMQSA